jgi:hypothetical protein
MLSTKTILGAGWSVSSRLGGRVIDFVTVLVLARTLTPADFGLTALAMTLIAIVDTVLEIPLLQALTRLKCVEKSHLDTAFTLGVLRGLLVSLVVLAAAWPFSIIFHDSRLTALVAALAMGPIARSLYSPGMVKFIRQMSFRETFMAEFVGKILASTTAIALVHLGGGYWDHCSQQHNIFCRNNTHLVSPCPVPTCPFLDQPFRLFDISGMVQFGASSISLELAIRPGIAWLLCHQIRSGTVYDGKRSVRLAHAEFDRSGNEAGYGGVLEN